MTRPSLDSDATSSATPRKRTTVYTRSLSASEIARNAKSFDTWCSYQGCEQVAFSDLPSDFKGYVDSVFDTQGLLPKEWVDPSSKFYRRLRATSSPDFVDFLTKAHEECPQLFSKASSGKSNRRLLDEMRVVFFSWERLQRMRSESKDRVFEADFVSNVYEGLRSCALRQSTYRAKWPIALPQPLPQPRIRTQSLRILNAKSVIPDCAVFVPEKAIRKLSLAAESAFKQLKRSKLAGSPGKGEESFACQSTPCVHLPGSPGFQFASSFWEDKKPVHSMLEDAYRQNRMSTAAAVRHLHSLHVQAPVFGLVWSDGIVRAHVDWCTSKGQEPPIVRSALFPGHNYEGGAGDETDVHEWNLDSPANIIQIFLLIKNIDHWTVNDFMKCIEAGIADLKDSVLLKNCPYQPWKRVGTFKSTQTKDAAENSSPQVPPQHQVAQNTRSRRCRGKVDLK